MDLSKTKFLNFYLEELNQATYKKNGAFYAFNNNDFKEKYIEENKPYYAHKIGLFVPVKNNKKFFQEINANYKIAIKKDKRDNGLYKIILRELLNYESFYTYNWKEAANALKDYGVEEYQVRKVFNSYYNKWAELFYGDTWED